MHPRWIRERNSPRCCAADGVLQGEHPIMNGEAQRIPATNDKRGTIFYVAHEDGVRMATRKTIGPNKSSAGKPPGNI